MRVLGFLLIGSALLLGAGGVDMHASAESATTASTDAAAEPEAQTSETAPPAAAQCSDPGPGRLMLRLEPRTADSEEQVLPLNTRGYNYTPPGEIRPYVPSTRGTPPASPA
jgi:hypothetical protein